LEEDGMAQIGKRKGARGVALALALGVTAATGSLWATGSGVERPGHALARISPATERTQKMTPKMTEEAPSLPVEPGFRSHFGHSDVYIPSFFRPAQGSYDVIVHFHGLREAQESNVDKTRLNAVIVSVNLGMGSGPYEDAFKDPGAFPRLLGAVERTVEKSGRAPGARVGRIALSAWSAGYGAVSAILRQPEQVKRIDAVLLADGLHANYRDEKKHLVDDAPLAKYARIADSAFKGEKLFAMTHSSITTYGYPNTTETIGELLKITGTPRTESPTVGPRNMRQLYESHRGDFHVRGYEGTGVKDHIDHIWGMGETLLPYLKDRWSR
jgi:hypothetical protein